jgi:hypothetical protein
MHRINATQILAALYMRFVRLLPVHILWPSHLEDAHE